MPASEDSGIHQKGDPMAATLTQPKPPGPGQAKPDVEWYRLQPPEVADRLHANLAQGLSAAEAQQRL
jgi:hypothetical protein